MAGRPKNPNRPPTVTAVRITERTREKLQKLHRRWGSKEPFNNTIERALDQAEYYRKKVEGLQVEIEDQRQEIETKGQAYFKLFTLKENLRQRVERLEKEREQFIMKRALK
jgi:hypothetical protein